MDYYKILGVSIYSSDEEIKKAYHVKAHENHPDKGGNESKMKEINNAYYEIVNSRKFNFKVNTIHQNTPNRPIHKCSTCGKDTHYSLCLDCWIKIKREEKRKRIHNIRSFMFCLNCNKSLYNRNPRTLFCDIKCSKQYYIKRGKVEIEKNCQHNGKCINKEEASRLKNIGVEKIVDLKYKERIAIFTRLIGRKKAIWFDSELQKKFK
jgi:curved DNA-binding protein CbpA